MMPQPGRREREHTHVADVRGPRVLRSFRHRDFRLLWLGMLVVNALLPLQFVTASLYLLHRGGAATGVALAGGLAASRGAGMLCCALVGGVYADRMDRRRLLLAVQTVALCANGLIALLMLYSPLSTPLTISALFACAFVAAGALAVDSPTRQAMIPQLVGEADMANAIALDVTAIQLAFPLSLPLAGVLIDTIGFGWTYAVSLVGHVAVLAALRALRYRGHAVRRSQSIVGDLRAGFGYAWRHRTVWWMITLVFAITTLAQPGVGQLGPIWMRTVLGLTPTQFGFMAATWGIGTVVGSVTLAQLGHVPYKGTMLTLAAAAFCGLVLVFGYSRSIPLTAAANFGLGLTLALTTVSAVALTQRLVPNTMQGRVMSLFMLNQGLSQFAAGPIGLLGQVASLPLVVPLMGWLSLVVVVPITLTQAHVRAAGRLTAHPEARAGSSETPGTGRQRAVATVRSRPPRRRLVGAAFFRYCPTAAAHLPDRLPLFGVER
jgi:predicted MFS family arabinose efflux permease